jgi:hypothetical protein
MVNLIRTVLLLGMVVASTASFACTVSFVSSVKTSPRYAIDRATAIVAGRATSIVTDQMEGTMIARLEIDTVFKGQAPGVLVVRASLADHPCGEATPPGAEPFFAFIRADTETSRRRTGSALYGQIFQRRDLERSSAVDGSDSFARAAQTLIVASSLLW